jgi:hypothetical protein
LFTVIVVVTVVGEALPPLAGVNVAISVWVPALSTVPLPGEYENVPCVLEVASS